MPTIYLVSANPFPAKPLQIDVEQRAILRRLPPSWDIKPGPAARIGDIVSDLRRYKPDIVHFSAHGSPTERLVLLDDDGKPREVSRATVNALFAEFKESIALVVLNACYSRTQAEMIAANIGCVIGVSGTLADTNAIKYAEQFYEGLAAGLSVEKAHSQARIILTDVLSDHKPELIANPGVDAAAVFVAKASGRGAKASRQQTRRPKTTRQKTAKKSTAGSPVTRAYAARKLAGFDEAVERYGVSADRFTVLKIDNPDGSFVCRYEIENLKPAASEISSVSWRFLAPSGLVMAPNLDDELTNAGVAWTTEPDPPPSSFEDVLKNLGTLRGMFTFDPPLTPKCPGSFAWTMQVLNGDALTAWEFHSLYSPQQQVHVSGKPLSGKPSEYFAQLVWFPVKQLHMELRLPPSQTARPQLRYFELKDAKRPGGAPVDQVLKDGELRAHPDYDSEWGRQNAKWQRNSEIERLERGVSGSSAEAELTVEYPIIGSQYSLDWTLPDPPLPANIDPLVAEAVVVRDGLLAHRSARVSGTVTPYSGNIRALFRAVHNEARDFLKAKEPSFATALMTWDREQRRMVIVEVCRNDDRANDGDWKFWLPFGLGLAGMCFRTATGAFRYQRNLDLRDPARPENYLPVPGSKPHALLLSLPIDHPEMTEEMGHQTNAQRCRQLVGVLSISSGVAASHLREYCRETLTDGQWERLRDLRDACQKRMDIIAEALLDAAGLRDGGQTSTSPAAAMPGAAEAEPATRNGLVHQPGPDWKSPVPANRFLYKVAAFDYDGTLLRGENFTFSWELIWQALGFTKAIQHDLKREYRRQTDEARTRAERIEAYKRWCERAVEKFKSRGLTRVRLRALSQPLKLTKNCRAALKQLRAEGVVTTLISGGISAVLEDTFPDYRDYFDFVFMNELLFDADGVVSGVRATAYDFEGKADALAYVCDRAGATRDQTVFIGDHFNDEAVMLRVKTAIAYPPGDDVTESVSHVAIREDNLLAVVPYVLAD